MLAGPRIAPLQFANVNELITTLLNIPLQLFRLPLALITRVLLKKIQSCGSPPGPAANVLPIVGSLPLFTSRYDYYMLSRMAKLYGSIYKLNLGTTTFVVISDPELLLEAFNMDDVSGRTVFPVMNATSNLGIFHAEGDLASNQRAFIERFMGNLHIPNQNLYRAYFERASVATGQLLEELDIPSRAPIHIDTALDFTIVNILFSVLVQTVFSRNDEALLALISSTQHISRNTHLISLPNCAPMFSRLSQSRRVRRDIMDWRTAFRTYMEPIVQWHRRELNPDNPKDLIDAFLIEMDRPNAGNQAFFTEEQLYAVLRDIFSTTLITISATIRWLLLAVLHENYIQTTIKKEIDKFVRTDARPTFATFRVTPYLQATIREGLRFSSIFPLGVSRSNVRGTSIGNYNIPARATIIGLFWDIHRNENLWRFNPSEFHPSNHLNTAGTQIKESENLMAFSTGTRSCLGKDVSFSLIYFIFSNLIHKFKLLKADDLPRLHDCRYGVLREPHPFRMHFHPHIPVNSIAGPSGQ